MTYTPADKFPKLLQASQLSRPDAQNPRLAQPIDATQTTIELTCEPQNYDGTPLTGNFHIGIAGTGTTETVYCGPGGVSGTTLTVVRGVRPNGIDYTTGDPAFATAHAQDSAVFFDVSAIHFELISSTLTGDIPTGDNNFRVGDLTAADIKNYYSNDQTDKPYDYYDESAQRPRFHMGDDGPSAGQELEGVILKGTTVQLAALPELPTGGMVAYDTTLAQTVFREGGAWVPNAAGGTVPDASTTVAGKGQVATTTAANNATDAGSTGAINWMPPAQTARVIQEARYVYAASTTGNDTYVATFTPAAPASDDGHTYWIKMDVTNTGACSLNGVAIKLKDGSDPANGDIAANSINPFTYNSTGPKWELQCPTAQTYVTSSQLDPPVQLKVNNRRVYRNESFIDQGIGGTGVITKHSGYVNISTGGTTGGDASNIMDMATAGIGSFGSDVDARGWCNAVFDSTTQQDAWIGFFPTPTTQPVNNVLTADHAAFLVADNVMIASVANGTTQSVSSALTVTLTEPNLYYIENVGNDWNFYINNSTSPVATLSLNRPDNNLIYFTQGIATTENVAKSMSVSGITSSADRLA